jgi:hypothetical protein
MDTAPGQAAAPFNKPRLIRLNLPDSLKPPDRIGSRRGFVVSFWPQSTFLIKRSLDPACHQQLIVVSAEASTNA